MEPIRLTSASAEQTREIAAAVARELRPGDVVLLAGDLGSGKTCFVQGAARALGVRARVQSPSFVLVREYAGAIGVTHADVYRLDHLQELIDLGYEELFDRARVLFVEWGDAVEGELPIDRLEVRLARADGDERAIELVARGSLEARADAIARAVEPWVVTGA